MTESTVPPWARACLATAVAAIAGWQVAALGFGDPVQVARAGLLKDDAFSYTVLVDNFRRVGFFTFDGVMPTNGFQPLWMFVLLILKSVMPGIATPTLLQGLSWVCWVTFSWLVTWFVSGVGGPLAAGVRSLIACAMFLHNRLALDLLVQGLEVPLGLVLLAGIVIVVNRFEADPRRLSPAHGLALGALGGLTFLCRTDLFWVALGLGIWLLRRSGPDRRALLAFGGVTASIVVPYLVWNLVGQGSLMPISGRVKLYYMNATFPSLGAYLRSNEWHGLPTVFQIVLPWLPFRPRVPATAVALGMAAFWAWKRGDKDSVPGVLKMLAAVCVAHSIYLCVVYREVRPYSCYYFAPEVLFVTLVVAWAASTIRRPAACVAVSAAIALAYAGTWLRPLTLDPTAYWDTRIALAQRLPSLTGGGPVAAFWPGAFAQFSGTTVIPVDGIIGSSAYFNDYVKSGRELDYARERGARWVIAKVDAAEIFAPEPPRLATWADTGTLRLWESRARLRHVHAEGNWHLFALE